MTYKFVPGLDTCRGCIYYDYEISECNRSNGPKLGYDRAKKLHRCIVKDVY